MEQTADTYTNVDVCVLSIAAEATGLNMMFASNPQNGSLYGSGLYVGFDDHIAHTYV